MKLQALCIIDLDFLYFRKGEYYEYHTTTHEETHMTLYHVGPVSHPMTKDKFNMYFSDIQEVRNKRINLILSDDWGRSI